MKMENLWVHTFLLSSLCVCLSMLVEKSIRVSCCLIWGGSEIIFFVLASGCLRLLFAPFLDKACCRRYDDKGLSEWVMFNVDLCKNEASWETRQGTTT